MYTFDAFKSCLRRELSQFSNYLSLSDSIIQSECDSESDSTEEDTSGPNDCSCSTLTDTSLVSAHNESLPSWSCVEQQQVIPALRPSQQLHGDNNSCSSERASNFHLCRLRPRRQRQRRQRILISPRIVQLARPRYYTPRFGEPQRWKRVRGPEAVRLDTHHVDAPLSTRLQQLSLPTVRVLRAARREYRHIVDGRHFGIMNRHLQSSLYTMYTRLANVPMPKKSPKVCVDWPKHNAWLEKRAQPKMPTSISDTKSHRPVHRTAAQIKLQRPLPESQAPPYDIQRLRYLAMPRTQYSKYTSTKHLRAGEVPRSALKYKMTKRMDTIATPFKPPPDDPLPEYERCAPVPRIYDAIATVGIAKLAQPRVVRKRWTRADAASVVFTVSEGAKKYKTSARMKVLCKPKTVDSEEPVKEPFAVKKSGLKKILPDKEAIYRKLAGLKALEKKPKGSKAEKRPKESKAQKKPKGLKANKK